MSSDDSKTPQREISAKSLFADASWRSVGYGVSIVAKFILTPILARILAPEEFGVAAIGFSIVIFFFIVGYAGLPQALIVAKDDKPELWSTAFWMNLGIGLVLAAGAFLGAPLLAGLVKTPEATPLIQAFSLLIPLQLLQSIGWARLTRDQRHSRLATADMSADILGAVCAVVAAFLGAGVWSLVIQQFVSLMVRLPIVLWRAGLKLRLHCDPRELKPHAAFSANVLATDVFLYFIAGLPMVILGRNLQTAAIGIYDVSMRLSGLPRMILSSSLVAALLPAFVRMRDDPERMKRASIKSVHMSNAVQAPVYLGMAAVSEPAVRLLFGDKWEAAIPIMSIMCITALIRSVVNGSSAYFSSMGLAHRNLLVAFLFALGSTLGAYIGAQAGTLMNVVLGMLVGNTLAAVVVQVMWMRHLGVRIGDGSLSAMKPFIAAGIMGAVVWFGLENIKLFTDFSALRLAVSASIGAVIYGVAMLIVDRPTILSILGLAGGRIPAVASLVARLESKQQPAG